MNKNVSSTLNMLIGTDAEAAALRREATKARMNVIKMRIDLKKSDPTLSKDEIDILLPLP